MTIGDALAFIKRSLSDASLRAKLNGAGSKEELEKILAEELLSFNPDEFDDAFNHKLTECQEEEDADQLKELKLWWDLLGQVLEPSACKAGCSGCC